jgi:predicted PurR-regulated permease PerM
MTEPINKDKERAGFDPFKVDTAIRLGFIALLVYWALRVIGPFLTIAMWSGIISVALYPFFNWLARLLGHRRRLAATVVTILSLIVVIGPVTWLGFGLVTGLEFVVDRLDSHSLIPMPPESIRTWPLVGEPLHQRWTQAATDIKATLTDFAPTLKPLAGKLLNIAGSVGFGLLELGASIIIAGFLYSPGPQLIFALSALLRRALGDRSEEMFKIAGSTIRNVSRGVIGVSFVQTVLAGIGFVLAGIPGAGFLSLLVLILGIVQIGPTILLIPIVIWSWTTMTSASAVLLTAYLIPVGLVDNIARPLVMARGLTTPMPVILVGVLGGPIAYGIGGLFLGPIVLSVVWSLLVAGAQVEVPAPAQQVPTDV